VLRWALVNLAGTAIIAQSGGISVASHPLTGETRVDFGTTTSGHAVWAVQNALDNVATTGAALVAPCGPGADSYPNCAAAGNINLVDVQTHDAAGALANRSFYVYFMP
jgi:hypothetical protein